MSRFTAQPPCFGWLPLVSLAFCAVTQAAEPPAFTKDQIAFFERDVRPLLVENCQKCHGATSAKLGLRLDSRDGVLKGSDYRPVVDLENPDRSVLLHAVRHTGETIGGVEVPKMPDKGPRLQPKEIAALAEWIRQGLPWPAEKAPAKIDPKTHWAYQPLRKVEIPAGDGNPIDRFLNAALAKAGLEPAPEADPATLYRRLNIDLLGLQPTYQDIQAFVADTNRDAWERLVERLLGSPAYGERWARHWMDVARYSDTKGYEAGGRERRFIFSHTYRDWLIESFNRDLPYDQFLMYQVAADQMVDWKSDEKTQLAALGFLTLSKNGTQEEIFDDRLDTIFRGTMGLTIACARCHDHKFDPISTKEYYGLYGVLLNSVEPARPELPVIGCQPEGPEYEAYQTELAKKQKVVDDFLAPQFETIAKENPQLAQNRAAMMAKLPREQRKKLSELQRDVDKYVADSAMEADRALIVKDRPTMINQQVFIRGNASRRGEVAPRGFLAIASAGRPTTFTQGSGRLELGKAIVARDNPLTARVMVNRVWMHHFGEGLVRSVSDFGVQGEHPTHPELLDWLASWFMDQGWSLKALHKLIVTSEAYQRSSSHPHPETCQPIDPENRLLWEMPRRRLDFETLRDSMLTATGLLDPRIGGRGEDLFKPPFSRRRTLYAFIDRQNLDPVFRHFDFANPQEHTGKRQRTTIPMQALFALNSDFFKAQARALLNRPDVVASSNPVDKIRSMNRAVFARDPDSDETQMGLAFIDSYVKTAAGRTNQQTLSTWQYGYGGWNSVEKKAVFQAMPHWSGDRWQIGDRFPVTNDPRSYLNWTRTGGSHPGNGELNAAVVRWTAPGNMRIRITGKLTRPAVNLGDGIRWRLLLGNQVLREETLTAKQKELPVLTQEIAVTKGQNVDFAIDARGDTNNDSFGWAPSIQQLDGAKTLWDFTTEFSGPQTVMDAWQAYAQALLCTNEAVFVD